MCASLVRSTPRYLIKYTVRRYFTLSLQFFLLTKTAESFSEAMELLLASKIAALNDAKLEQNKSTIRSNAAWRRKSKLGEQAKSHVEV
jgi:hypothetical protein